MRKFAPVERHDNAIDQFRTEQRSRALRYMLKGLLEPRNVAQLMKGFEDGVAIGLKRELTKLESIPLAREGFKPFPQRFQGQHMLVSGSWFRRRVLRQHAQGHVANNMRTSLFIFSPTLCPHKVKFTRGGVWEQTGGLYGRSIREGAHFLINTRKKRLAQELKRLAKLRDLSAET